MLKIEFYMIQKILFFLKKIGIKILAVLLKGLVYLKKILIFILTWTVARPMQFIAKTVLFSLVLKIYKLCLFLKIKWEKIYAPIKKKYIYPLTRRYVTHSIIILITIFSVGANINAKEASLETAEQVGQKSILFALSYDKENFETFVQETADTGGAKISNYLDQTTSVSLQPSTAGDGQDTPPLPTASDDSALLNPNLPSTSLNLNPRTKITEYKVEGGDAISTIAEKFNITTSTILWANNLAGNDLIRPGDKLIILPINGVLHKVKKNDTIEKIAKYYNAESEKIIEFNALADAKDLAVDEFLIVPDGKVPPPPPPAPQPRSRLALPYIIKKTPATSKSGRMVWPASGRITQYFGWRHTGLDVAAPTGTPIYAAESGIIKYTGWGRGYGNEIVISHGNGVETRYAHLSKFLIEQGNTVTKGEIIGLVGSTGWSTGPHVHFEVMINGSRVNPLNYL